MEIRLTGVYNPERRRLSAKGIGEAKNIYKYAYGSSNLARNFDTVSFGASISQLKAVEELPCFDCNKPMIPDRIYKSIQRLSYKTEVKATDVLKAIEKKLRKEDPQLLQRLQLEVAVRPELSMVQILSKSKIETDSRTFRTALYKRVEPEEFNKKMFALIAPYKELLFPTEKAVFEKLELLHQQKPASSLKSLLQDLRPEHLEKLEKIQKKLLNLIEIASFAFSKKSRLKIQAFVTETRQIIIDESLQDPFKRKTFIGKLVGITETFPKLERLRSRAIIKIAQSFPTSSNNESAFIVKYSGKAPEGPGEEKVLRIRSSKESALRLIQPSVQTFEHLEAHHPETGFKNGPTTLQNLVLEHGKCNGERRNKRLHLWVKIRRRIINNAQKYLDVMISLLNKGKYPDLYDYPLDIAKTFERETSTPDIVAGRIKTNGIKLDISALDETVRPSVFYPQKPVPVIIPQKAIDKIA